MKRTHHQLTLYIKESDLAIYEKAKQKGSLASVIPKALRQYLSENQEAPTNTEIQKEIREVKKQILFLQKKGEKKNE
jgi:hypothetical protein